LSLTPGYDSNVLRLSSDEMSEATLDQNILGSMSTFDSAYLRLSGSLNSLYRLKHRTNYIKLFVSGGYTSYLHSSDKNYTSGKVSMLYQWRRHFRIESYVKRLNKYYLRDYVNRDVSNDIYSGCLFTDEEYGGNFTFPVSKWLWFKTGIFTLKRYYNAEFAEFDLDILAGTAQGHFKPLNNLNFSLQVIFGSANNITFNKTARSSNFDRSYTYFEYYVPVTYSLNNTWISEVGSAYRQEYRKYIAETFDDPLHSGRDHIDRKFDLWFGSKLNKDMDIKFQIRFRNRTTFSEFEWVEELKSFNQVQAWMTFSRRLVYDRY